MRANVRAIHGIGDFVPGWFSVPKTPVVAMKRTGMGDFVPGYFAVPQTPVGAKRPGMSGLGCGSDCGCGPCRSHNGMGQIDFSLTGDGISQSLVGSFGITSVPAVPNWIIYAGGIAIIYAIYSSERHGRRR